jgi:magnesium chelatase subunit I
VLFLISFLDTIRKKINENNESFYDIKGKEKAIFQLKSALTLGRHVILVGPPGVGKTTLAKSIAQFLPEIEVNECGFNCFPNENEINKCPICKSSKQETKKINERFIRIQGSPDLTAEDLLGDIDPIKAMKYGPLSIEAFTPGKIFKANKGILFFDEINRCPEKLQNALLQVLEEGKVTLGSYSFELPADFILIATMNPEDSSTEKLSDVFVDRFDFIYVNYPETIEIEKDIVNLRKTDMNVIFPQKLFDFVVSFIHDLRQNKDIEKKPSIRATIGLIDRSVANANLNNRKEVNFNDIKDSLISVLGHRISLKPSLRYVKSQNEFIKDMFNSFSEKNLDDELKGDVP